MNPRLQTIDGRPTVRIERRLAHPPKKVWRAITEPVHLDQWYPFRTVEIDLRLGGKIRFDDGQGTTMDATITEFDPPRVFAFSEHAPPEMTRESDDLVHFELRADGDGCMLIFTHIFDDRPAAASYATGWHGCLDALELVLDGRAVELATNWAELHERYIEAFGLNQGSAETLPDGWRVRFERQLMGQPVDKVWAALNGSSSDGHAPTAGELPPAEFTIKEFAPAAVTAVEAPRLLEYGWRFEDRSAGLVRWELSNGPGGARIVLTQTGPSELADLQPAALAAWQTHIEGFVKGLVSQAAPPPPGPQGTLGLTQNGRPALRFERRLAHPPEKVWRAITEREHLRAWFPAVVDFDLTPGAKLRFNPTPEQQARFSFPDLDPATTNGEVTLVEPPHLLEYTWGAEILRWELEPDSEGGCRLVFTNVIEDRDSVAAIAAGWHAGLEVVEAQLDGRAIDWSAWDRADQLGEEYARSFGNENREPRTENR